MATRSKTQSNEINANLTMYGFDGKETGTVSFPAHLIDATAKKETFDQYVRMYLANQHQGTHSTLTRSEIVGSTKKIYRQKGTGNARHGSKKAPIFVGGGVTFAVKPRDYTQSMNKKQKREALKYAITAALSQGSLAAFEGDLKKPTTKKAAALIRILEKDKAVLVVLPTIEDNALVKSFRNIGNVELLDAKSINPYVLAKYKKILFAKDAVTAVGEHFNA